MRAAPAVTVELVASPRWTAVCVVLGAVAAAAASAAICAHLVRDAIMAGLFIASATAAGALLLWRVRPPGGGRLRWDGDRWWHREAGSDASERAGSLMVMIDLGGWMLLRFLPEGGPGAAWLPVSEGRVPQAGALRAAAYAAPPEGAAR